MVEIVTFDSQLHKQAWEEFIATSYLDPNYVMLSPTFLRWQFFDNPANTSGGYTVLLILHQDKVVAQLGFVPFRGIAPEGSRFIGAYPINLMVRPEFRAMGLGAILLSRLLKQVPCLVNPGANEEGAALAKGLGLHDLGRLKRHIRVTNLEAARALAEEGQLPAVAEKLIDLASPSPRTRVIVSETLPSEAPEAFSPPISTYRAERDRTFFQWRYERHPAFKYEFVLSPNLESIAVFHEERERSTGALVFRIVDLLARDEQQEALLGAVVQVARERGAAIVDFFCSLSCYDWSLQKVGFFDEAQHSDGRIAALFQPLDFRDASIRVIASDPPGAGPKVPWYITKADSDQDRPNDKNAVSRDVSRATASDVDQT
jgi:GNAT superfamily N-acetyltransferase